MARWGPQFTLTGAQLSALTNEALILRSRELRSRFCDIEDKAGPLRSQIRSRRARLVKPAIKLAASTVVGIGGIMLSPLTFGPTLAFSILGIGLNAWDAVDFTRNMTSVVILQQHRRALRDETEQVDHELDLIEAILNKRRHTR